MKKVSVFYFFLIMFFLIYLKVYSQIEFIPHTITTNADGAASVLATDVDGDGDMDVLSASSIDHKIAWYENDGDEIFIEHVISTSADRAWSVYAADVNDDGDMDVLSASIDDNKIAWYENDGNENFIQHVISTDADGARSVYAEDVNNDGDMDVLSASQDDDKIAWYENDGEENFIQHVISTDADGALSVYAEDVNDDGDMDVLSASRYDDKIAWYENDGEENFIEHVISTSADGAFSVDTDDMDNDGDMDVLSASRDDNKMAWYENDGNENFTSHIITTGALFARFVYAADVDSDGDMDVLSASRNDDKIAWYENLLIGGDTEISVDIENIEVILQPDAVTAGSFNLSNIGESTLEYLIYTVDTTTGNRNLTGSYITCNADFYTAGTTAEWIFYVFNNSDDSEWINEVIIDFPEGVYVNSATNFIGGSEGDLIYDGTTGDGATITWFGETPEGWGVLLPGEGAIAQINVSIDSELETDLMIDYQISGDGWGQEPHTVYGQVVINYLGEQVEWITLEPVSGEILAGESEVIDYQIDATSLLEDLYTCDIYITGNTEEDLTIPVSLTVIGTSTGEVLPVSTLELCNYPNPFNPLTTINYQLSENCKVELVVYNLKGQRVETLVDETLESGDYSVIWDGKDDNCKSVSSGIYFYKLKTENNEEAKKMILMK